MPIVNYPPDCVLLEWNEKQQVFHYNCIRNGKPSNPPGTYGWVTLHVCKNVDDAILITEYLDKYFSYAKNKKKPVSLTQIRSYISDLTKVADALCSHNINSFYRPMFFVDGIGSYTAN